MFAVELVNVAFFACYVDAHKAGRDEAYSFGIGFLITACLMTGITLLDMVNAFCAKNGCWYVLSACFWVSFSLLFWLLPCVALVDWRLYLLCNRADLPLHVHRLLGERMFREIPW